MSWRRIAWLLACVAASLLTACAAPSTRVILLPQADGSASAVVVRANNDVEQTLSTPYARATTTARGAPTVDQADAAQVKASNRSLFEMMPPPPQNYTVYFNAGTTVLTAASQAAMNEALAAALARSGGEIVVTGHTDTVGSSASNDELSRRRALQVRQMLIEKVFPPSRIDVVARGERDLAVPTADEVDEPRNRRVTIQVR